MNHPRHLAGRALAMALLVAASGALAMPDTLVLQSCRWSEKIGQQRYIGTVEDALSRYTTVWRRDQIDVLRDAIIAGRPTTQVTMRLHSLVADNGLQIAPGIAMMHFGTKSVCMSVQRAWGPQFSARADLFAIPGSDLAMLVPHDCGNPAVVRLLAPYTPPAVARVPMAERLSIRLGLKPPPAVAAGPVPPFDSGVRRALDGHPVPWPFGGPPLGLATPGRGGGGGGGGAQQGTADAPNRIPEPGTWALLLSALAGAILFTRRKKG